MKILKPWSPNGNLLLHYKGKNIMMQRTSKGFTSHKVKLMESIQLQNYGMERCCFELSFYDKLFLLVIDGYKIYEIVTDGVGNRTHVELKDTWIYADFFEEKDLFIIKGQINYFNQVTPDFLVLDKFQFQANFINQNYIIEMFERVNANN